MNDERRHDDYAIALWYCYVMIEDVEEHLEFEKVVCAKGKLLGRIRVSTEGLNGVLSGTLEELNVYSAVLQEKLEVSEAQLDMKICPLRPDLTVDQQLFESLSIKATREVVSLFEPTPEEMRQMSLNKTQKGRRRRKKNKVSPSDESSERITSTVPLTPTDACLQGFTPAPHLSPQEWNDRLTAAASSSLREEVGDSIILDARNVYESSIGHFKVDGIPTLLTNTRKYSSLPQVLQDAKEHLAGKQVFMYCTGGVRCERASVYLQALASSDEWISSGLEKPKAIYQLEGGIQRYLEAFGSMSSCEAVSASPDDEGSIIHECLYRGKNFVFDPRRTDPQIGEGTVGTCLMCRNSYDDYDNGHAPVANKETRCVRCRVLVLVCPPCRMHVQAWGEDDDEKKANLFCGGTACIDQGNRIAPEILKS